MLFNQRIIRGIPVYTHHTVFDNLELQSIMLDHKSRRRSILPLVEHLVRNQLLQPGRINVRINPMPLGRGRSIMLTETTPSAHPETDQHQDSDS